MAIKLRYYLKSFEQLNISRITYYEIFAGLKFKKAEKQLIEFEDFISSNNIINITEESAKVSGDIYSQLRQQGITIGTADILIAGIAIENQLTLITNNEKHYNGIYGLTIDNWMS